MAGIYRITYLYLNVIFLCFSVYIPAQKSLCAPTCIVPCSGLPACRCQVFGCSALSGAGLIEVQQWLAAAAVAVSKSNSYWPPSSCRSFHRDTSRPLSACDSTSFRDRRDEMLGTFATATPPGSQAGLSLAVSECLPPSPMFNHLKVVC